MTIRKARPARINPTRIGSPETRRRVAQNASAQNSARPAGSAATLSDTAAVRPTFEVDAAGTYIEVMEIVEM